MVSFRRCGRMVSLSTAFKSTADIAPDSYMLDIPTAHLPISNMSGVLVCVSSSNQPIMFSLYDSKLYLSGNSAKITAGVVYGGSCCYIAGV